MVTLAVFFGEHVFWVETALPHWDWRAIALDAAAAGALLCYRVGTIKLILACAAAVLVLSYLS